MSRPMIGGLMILGAAVCFGAMPTFTKAAYDHGANPVGLLVIRFAIAAPILIAIGAAIDGMPRPRAVHGRVALLALLFTAQSFSFFQALSLTSATITVLLLYTYPLVVTLVAALLLDEELTRGKLAVLAIGFLGVTLAVGGVEGDVNLLGLALGLCSGLLFAAFLLVTKRLLDDQLPPLEMVGFMYGFTAIVYAVVAIVGGAAFPADQDGWLAMIGVVSIGTVASMGLFVSGLRRLPAGVTSMLSTLEPAVGVALAAIFLGEALTGSQALGVGLVLLSLFLLGGLMTRAANQPAHTP